MTSSLQESFIKIIRLGIGHQTEALSSPVNWDELQTLAERQGLSAVLVDGIEQLPDSQRPPKDVLLQMIGQVVQGYELRYESYRRAIAELASFYTKHDLKMMVLKGYACSLDWPKPEHRPCGDIDIWQFGKQKEADALLESEKKIKIDDSHEHHTVFSWFGFMVENHYDFIDTHHRASSPELEKIFKDLGSDDSYSVDLKDTSTGSATKVYVPSPNLHALFLLRHMMEHFAAEIITIRHLLDWGFYVNGHSKEIDWGWLEGVLNKYGMTPAYNIFNGICVDDLGFSSKLFPNVQYLPDLKERVLNDILSPEFCGDEPQKMLSRVIFKYKRWKANEWKHRLCYNDSMWSTFWSCLWGHILKPSQI